MTQLRSDIEAIKNKQTEFEINRLEGSYNVPKYMPEVGKTYFMLNLNDFSNIKLTPMTLYQKKFRFTIIVVLVVMIRLLISLTSNSVIILKDRMVKILLLILSVCFILMVNTGNWVFITTICLLMKKKRWPLRRSVQKTKLLLCTVNWKLSLNQWLSYNPIHFC